MKRSVGWLMAGSILLTSCGIDFVAVEEIQSGQLLLRSEHEKLLQVSFDLALAGEGAPPLATVDGVKLQWEQVGGHWRAQTMLSVDSLHPHVEVVIQGGDRRVLILPVVARNGAAFRQPDGDLELPLKYDGNLAEWEVSWGLTLRDSGGESLLWVDSRTTPLPSPLVLPRPLVPYGAVAAEFFATLRREGVDDEYPLNLGILSRVTFPIPNDSLR